MKMRNKIIQGDCLELMKQLDDKSIDLIFCDLPYGTTACKWDSIIPLDKLWEQYKRIIKPGCAILLFGSQPFTSKLVMSNLKWFKCEWIWEKSSGSNFATAKYHPLKEHESILVFSKDVVKYNPILEDRKGAGTQRIKLGYKSDTQSGDYIGNLKTERCLKDYNTQRYPGSIQFFNNREDCRGLHPTQKPVKLCEYFIKTYSDKGNLILDNCAGSGSLLVAAQNTNRDFIGFETDKKYFDIAYERLGFNHKKLGEYT